MRTKRVKCKRPPGYIDFEVDNNNGHALIDVEEFEKAFPNLKSVEVWDDVTLYFNDEDGLYYLKGPFGRWDLEMYREYEHQGDTAEQKFRDEIEKEKQRFALTEGPDSQGNPLFNVSEFEKRSPNLKQVAAKPGFNGFPFITLHYNEPDDTYYVKGPWAPYYTSAFTKYKIQEPAAIKIFKNDGYGFTHFDSPEQFNSRTDFFTDLDKFVKDHPHLEKLAGAYEESSSPTALYFNQPDQTYYILLPIKIEQGKMAYRKFEYQGTEAVKKFISG